MKSRHFHSVSPAGLSSDQQLFSVLSAAPRIAGADPTASRSGSGRPRSQLPAVCSAARGIEPGGTRQHHLSWAVC